MALESLAVEAISPKIEEVGQKRSDPNLADPCAAPAWQTPISAAVRRAVLHMTENYAYPVTLRDIADLTNCSPSQLIRAFRRELGTTPHAWLIRLRISVGTAMLQRGERIASVASEVGFVDQTHFTRHFKRLHGQTPRRFLDRDRYRYRERPRQDASTEGSA